MVVVPLIVREDDVSREKAFGVVWYGTGGRPEGCRGKKDANLRSLFLTMMMIASDEIRGEVYA